MILAKRKQSGKRVMLIKITQEYKVAVKKREISFVFNYTFSI